MIIFEKKPLWTEAEQEIVVFNTRRLLAEKASSKNFFSVVLSLQLQSYASSDEKARGR